MRSFTGVRLLVAVAVFALCAASGVHADTIISTVGGTDQGLGLSSGSQVGVVSFTLGQNYSNVSLSAILTNSGSPSGGQLEAFLTNQIGAGTTAAANEIANHTFTIGAVNVGVDQDITVMSLGSLSAGTYFLTITPVSQTTFGWSQTTSPANIAAAGDSIGQSRVIFPNASYIPASTSGFQLNQDLEFHVDATSPVPEPASFYLLGSGLFGLIELARRRK